MPELLFVCFKRSISSCSTLRFLSRNRKLIDEWFCIKRIFWFVISCFSICCLFSKNFSFFLKWLCIYWNSSLLSYFCSKSWFLFNWGYLDTFEIRSIFGINFIKRSSNFANRSVTFTIVCICRRNPWLWTFFFSSWTFK